MYYRYICICYYIWRAHFQILVSPFPTKTLGRQLGFSPPPKDSSQKSAFLGSGIPDPSRIDLPKKCHLESTQWGEKGRSRWSSLPQPNPKFGATKTPSAGSTKPDIRGTRHLFGETVGPRVGDFGVDQVPGVCFKGGAFRERWGTTKRWKKKTWVSRKWLKSKV